MPTFIKTGYWEKLQKGYKGWLNLDEFFIGKSTAASAGQIAFFDTSGGITGSSSLIWNNVNNRLTIGAGGFSGDFEINKQSAILLSYRNNNNGVNLINGANVFQQDMLGQRSGAAATLARITLIYNGDGTTRRGKLMFAVAESSGFGGQNLVLTQAPSNSKTVIAGQGAFSYLDNDSALTTTYGLHANLIASSSSFSGNAHPLSIDKDGIVQSIFFNSGNFSIGSTTDDNTNKLQVAGSVISTQYRLSALNTAPASATATGTLGEIRIDANHIYVCTATNTWKRAAIATW
jgi:hypothetical protein